jgi:hypothetical protein
MRTHAYKETYQCIYRDLRMHVKRRTNAYTEPCKETYEREESAHLAGDVRMHIIRMHVKRRTNAYTEPCKETYERDESAHLAGALRMHIKRRTHAYKETYETRRTNAYKET